MLSLYWIQYNTIQKCLPWKKKKILLLIVSSFCLQNAGLGTRSFTLRSFTLRSYTQNRSFLRATVSDLLMSLFIKERLWVIRSIKKINVSDSLCFEKIARKKRAIRSKNSDFLYVFDSFPPFYAQEQSLTPLFAHSLFFKEQLERFAHVALYKRATWVIRSGPVSNSLTSLFKKEQKCN